MTNGQAGKGDRYRPVDPKKYAENYEKAFPKKKSKKNSKKGQMQAGGIIDNTDIPQPEDDVNKNIHTQPGVVEDWKDKDN